MTDKIVVTIVVIVVNRSDRRNDHRMQCELLSEPHLFIHHLRCQSEGMRARGAEAEAKWRGLISEQDQSGKTVAYYYPGAARAGLTGSPSFSIVCKQNLDKPGGNVKVGCL